MKNLKLFLTLTALIYCAKLFSQESIVFDKQYLFDNQGSYIRDVKQTADSGYICAGSIGFSMYDERYLLFKTDSLGELEWYKYNITPAIHNNLWAVDITNTGNYIGIGTTMDNPEWHESGAIVMYDSIGDTLWTKQYAFKHPSIADLNSMITFYDGIYTSDNSIVAAGVILDDNLGSDHNPIVVKTNIEGDTLWTWRLFNADNTIVIESIVETKEGDYVAVGRADMPIIDQDKTYAPQRGFIVKLSPNGELIYLEEWTDIEFNYFTDVAINSNNELIISGVCFHHPPEYPDDECFGFILKTDNVGETIFYDIIGYGTGLEGLCANVSSSNEIIFVGMYAIPLSLDWNHDVLIRKYSDMGDVLWSKNIGEKDVINWPYALISTNDNGIAFCGLYSSNTGNYSWLVKTDSLGNGVYGEGWINNVNENKLFSGITIYPNPANDYLSLEFINPAGNCSFNIYTLKGDLVKSISSDQSLGFISINISDLQPGNYIVNCPELNSNQNFMIVR